MTPPVFGLRPILAARLRASKLPKPVICTLEPFFNSVAMMPLSSNSASTVRVASAFDILVRIAKAELTSALAMRTKMSKADATRTVYALVVEQCFNRARSISLRHLGAHCQRGGELCLVHCDLLEGGARKPA